MHRKSAIVTVSRRHQAAVAYQRRTGMAGCVLLGRDLATRSPLLLHDAARSRHVLVAGPTGVGKSTLIEHIVVADMLAGHGVVVFDTSGDLYRRLLRLVPAHRWRDVVLLDYADVRHPIARNPFAGVSLDDFQQRTIVTAAWVNALANQWGVGASQTSWGPVLEEFIQVAGYTLLCLPEATLVMLLRLVEDHTFRQEAMARVPNPVVRDYWRRFSERPDQGSRSKEEVVSSSLNKIRPYLINDVLLPIVGQRRSRFSWEDALARQQIVLVRVPEYFEAIMVRLVFGLEIARFSSALFQRLRSTHRPPVSLILDDLHRYAVPEFERWAVLARKANVWVTMTVQHLGQLNRVEGLREAMLNVGNRIFFAQVGGSSAET